MLMHPAIPLLILTLLSTSVAAALPGDGVGIRARVAPYRGRPTVFLNDTAVTPMIYALTDVPGGRMSWEELPRHNIARFARAGIRLFQVDVFLEQLWGEGESVDITLLRRQIAGVRDAAPGSGVIIRFHVTAPKWWMRKHPGEWVRYADTDYADETPRGSPGSSKTTTVLSGA